ncbi:MAG TPA: hypothetical protein VI423_01075 [Paenisporosarcina sp.]|nr:hypothetical protein [Paenisporosarcina sp.]
MIIFCLVACAERVAPPSPQSNEPDNQDVVPDDQEIQGEKEDEESVPVVNENPKTLIDSEIRVVMDKFQKIEDIVGATNSNMTFSDEDITQPEVMATKLQENLPESIKELVSSEMLNKQLPELIQFWYFTSGEDGFFPEVSLDARMEVVENTPLLIKVKTFQLNDFFQWNGNVYITAINENGKWLIDGGYEWVDVDEEPLNLSKEELLLHEKIINDSEIEFIAEETITSTTEEGILITANAIIFKIVKGNTLKARFTDTGEIAIDIPEKFKSTE